MVINDNYLYFTTYYVYVYVNFLKSLVIIFIDILYNYYQQANNRKITKKVLIENWYNHILIDVTPQNRVIYCKYNQNISFVIRSPPKKFWTEFQCKIFFSIFYNTQKRSCINWKSIFVLNFRMFFNADTK